MRIVNNAANLYDGATNINFLWGTEIITPELKKEMIRQWSEKSKLALVEMTIGMGAIMSGKNKPSNITQLASNQLSWAVMPNITNTAGICYYQSGFIGSAPNDTAYTVAFDANWMQAGMTITIPDTSGNLQYFYIYSYVGLHSGSTTRWDYQVKFIGQAGETVGTPMYGIAGSVASAAQTYASWASQLSATCDMQTTLTPTQVPDIYTNFTTIRSYVLDICRDEAVTKTFFVLDDGTYLWTHEKEHQWYIANLKSFELDGWVGKRTYQTVNSNYYPAGSPNVGSITNAAGATLGSGDGVFAQISGSNVSTLTLADWQPVNYAATLQTLKGIVTDYAIKNGIPADSGHQLVWYVGTKVYAAVQDILKEYADKSGGGISLKMTDYETGLEVISNAKAYDFAGFKNVFKVVSTWDNFQYFTNYTTSSSQIPLSSYWILMMPTMLEGGQPPIEVYFRGGEDFAGGFIDSLRPGTLDPTQPNGHSTINVTGKDGYSRTSVFESMIIVPDPLKLVWVKTTP